jgi:hypothetical protein
MLSGYGMVAVPLGELDGLAGPIAQIIELGPPGLAASDRLDIEDVWRMQWEDSFDSLVSDDSPDGEGFANPTAFPGYHRAGKYLRSLLVALFDKAVNLDDITYLEVRDLSLKTLALNGV